VRVAMAGMVGPGGEMKAGWEVGVEVTGMP